MSDRKYRQRGYQDDDRDRQPRPSAPRPAPEPGAPAGTRRISQDGPRNINMPGFREVVKCARCGTELTVAAAWGPTSQCPRCQADLHSCAQCTHFDTSAAFECQQPIAARVSPKDARNTCTHFEPRTTVERETKSSSQPSSPSSAKKAFDDLFK